MYYVDHPQTFAGLPVAEFKPDRGPIADTVEDPSAVAWRLEVDYDDGPEEFAELFNRLLTAIGGKSVTALVIGQWGGSAYTHAAPVPFLAGRAADLPNLRGLFLGDLVQEECEISWIQHTDLTPVIEAYPRLEHLTVRGGTGLRLDPMHRSALRSLVIEAGGLPAEVVRAVGESDLPAVEHLELWLGTGDYGGDATVEDLAGVLAGERLPAITSLGLRDAEIADQVAAAVASAPVVARLTTLDLSLGVLTDRGARALLAGQPLTHLRELNLEHHYLSTDLMDRLTAELAGVSVNLGGRQTDDEEDRYVAVGE